jgi:D-alanyl-lipoteichoic acid acyltransferase DltB (MBOAT superfamily)
VGISFYTFQTLSYTIDVYRGELAPEPSALRFFVYVAAFPQLVAGPIVRASTLLPQLTGDLRQRADTSGVFLIVYGLTKKLVLADVLGTKFVDGVFADPLHHSSLSLLLAVYAYAFQIFLDFSAYTDIARGCGRLLGLELPHNFLAPYRARSPADFWRRWHMTLSTWLRDYLYIPLGGNRGGKAFMVRNLMVTMLLGGLWHGADWKFIVWGALHGVYLVVYRLLGVEPGIASGRQGRRTALLQRMLFFHLVCLAWIFFRAANLDLALEYCAQLFSFNGGASIPLSILGYLLVALVLHDALEERVDAVACWTRRVPAPLLALGAVACFVLIHTFAYDALHLQAFIYFQF